MTRSSRKREELAACRRADAAPQPGDEQDGEWKREQLVAMDARFKQAVERSGQVRRGQDDIDS
jgi:hypothetical protein